MHTPTPPSSVCVHHARVHIACRDLTLFREAARVVALLELAAYRRLGVQRTVSHVPETAGPGSGVQV